MEIADIDALLMGFPKSGTTSLADWLDNFENVRLSHPKETFCFTPEFETNVKRAGVHELSQAFPPDDGQLAQSPILVEATTLNVYSESLFLKASEGSIKAIFVVRDSVDLVQSWHEQMVFAGDAFCEDLNDAWLHSLKLEQNPPEDFRQCYSLLFKQAYWINKWISKLGDQNVLIIHNSQLSNASLVASKISSFLNISLLNVPEMQRSNVRLRRSAKWLRFLKSKKLRLILRRVDPSGKVEVWLKTVLRRMFRSNKRTELSAELKNTIRTSFYDDMNQLESLLAKQKN